MMMMMIMKPSSINNNNKNNKQAALNGRRLLCLVVGLLAALAISGVTAGSGQQTKAVSASTAASTAAAAAAAAPAVTSTSGRSQKSANERDHLDAVPSEAQQSVSMPQQARKTTRMAAAGDLSAGQTNIANAKVQLNSPTDMAAAAGHHYGKSHGGHGKYYMYVESPKKGAYKMGYKRGNSKHSIMAKASVHKSHVHAYYKWHDKKGKGSHKFEYMHSGKKGKHY